MSHAFTRLFKCKEIGVNADHTRNINECCNTEDSLQFFNAAYKIQRKAVLDWNANADNETTLFNMGFVGIREDSAAGAGSVVLDMLLKFGLLNIMTTTPGTLLLTSIKEGSTALEIGNRMRTNPHLCQR